MLAPQFEPHRMRKQPHSLEDLDLAKRFAKSLHAELGGFLREIVFFGSAARNPHSNVEESDIDVLVIVNDATASLSNETVAAYRIITEKVAATVSGRLHINTLRISAFWEYVLNGDPVAVNMIRDGIPLLGSGFFEPFKSLLIRKEISPSKGNVQVYISRAPQTLLASRWHVLQATIDLYWACLDASHAALIHYGKTPDSPEETMHLVNQWFVERKMLDKSHLATLKDLYLLSNQITDRSIKDVSGKQFQVLFGRSKSLVASMRGIITGEIA